MDPQQRLLLEVAWEALEDAGQPPERLAGTATGVFMGVSSFDYYELLTKDPAAFDAYTGTGNLSAVKANRLSYFFDLKGPSMAIDTACSSSLVAVHLACQSLWSGESDPRARGRRAPPALARHVRGLREGGLHGPGRPLQDLRRARGRLRAGRGRGGRGPEAAVAGAGRGRPRLRGGAGKRREPGRGQQRDHGPQPPGPGSRARGGLPPGGGLARPRALRRGARDGHEAGRPDRDEGARGGHGAGTPAGRDVRGRLGQDEHRPPGGRSGDRGADQGRPLAREPSDPPEPALRDAEPVHPVRRDLPAGPGDPGRLAGRRRTRPSPASAPSASGARTPTWCWPRRTGPSPLRATSKSPRPPPVPVGTIGGGPARAGRAVRDPPARSPGASGRRRVPHGRGGTIALQAPSRGGGGGGTSSWSASSKPPRPGSRRRRGEG